MCCCCCGGGGAKVTFELTDVLRDLAEEMHLTDAELRRLFHCFCKMDSSKKGAVSKDDLLSHLALRHCRFLEMVFDDIDSDGDNHWNFVEWMIALARINLLTHDRLCEYMFSLFDANDTGYIDGENLRLLVETAHGPESMSPMDADAAIELYDEKHDNRLDMIEFRNALRYYPVLVWPIFEFQIHLETAVLGVKFWQDVFLRVHPELENHFFEENGAKLRDDLDEAVKRVKETISTCVPWFRHRHSMARAPELNLQKHNLEQMKIKDDVAKAGIVFDGLEAVGDHAVDQHDSQEEIEELTDHEDFDVSMYFPKNGPASSYS